MEQTKRMTVIELARAGHGPAAIIKLTGYPKSTVYDVYNRFMDEGKEERTPHKPRSDRKVTPTFLAGLKRTVEAKPDMHQTKLAKRKGVSRSTIQKALGDLGMKSYMPTPC